VPTARLLLFIVLVVALFSSAFNAPALVIQPVIYRLDEDASRAMNAAPLILVIETTDVVVPGDMRIVPKPPEVGGPHVPEIPLHLARFRAKVLLAVRGSSGPEVEFYSWVWASGKHGGPRLFNASPGVHHVLFLRQDKGYWHTVGDYPAYDLELYSHWIPAFLPSVNTVPKLVAARLHGEFDRLTAGELYSVWNRHSPVSFDYYLRDMWELIRLVGPLQVAEELDTICRNSPNRFGRIAACIATTREFPGRCEAYRLASEADPGGSRASILAKEYKNCKADEQSIWCEPLRLLDFYGWYASRDHLREAVRVHASAMDTEYHKAACALAARLPESRDIPECR